VVLGVVLLVIVGLTFGLGVRVGWQRARQVHPAVAGESSRKPTPTHRRGGLTEAGAERPPQLQEKLTFYQTLKAPLGPVQVSDKGDAAKPTKVPANPAKAPERASEGTQPRAADRETPRPTTVQSRDTGEGDETRGSSFEPIEGVRPEVAAQWTVQVGVFSTPQQAAGVRKQLAEKGFEAQVAPIATDNGQVRYRVRVGAFRSKEEAVRTAERVRSDWSLPTYVTTR
jgi:cell division protein FtsN